MVAFSVLIPVFNSEEHLQECVDSVLNQTFQNFEIILIDDGSTDGTGKYIASLMKKTNDFQIEYYYKPNGGLHTAYNEAIRHLQTELCMCCDSDDWLPDNCIEKIRKTWLLALPIEKKWAAGRFVIQTGARRFFTSRWKVSGTMIPAIFMGAIWRELNRPLMSCVMPV